MHTDDEYIKCCMDRKPFVRYYSRNILARECPIKFTKISFYYAFTDKYLKRILYCPMKVKHTLPCAN